MLKRLFLFSLVLLSSLMTTWAVERTYSPALDVCFRTGTGNTAWNSGYPKDAATDGNTVFESNYYAGIFTMQKYTVPDLQYATKITLTITVNPNGSGVDGTLLWLYPNSTWTASSGVDDIVGNVTTLIGIAPRATADTWNTPLATGAKVNNSSPAKGIFTISGDALTALKASATSDGTFSVLISNNKLNETNNSRKYQSSNTANDEANRPTLVATLDLPTVLNKTTGVSYMTLTEAFNAAVTAGTDAELEVSDNQTLTSRLTWNKATTLTITPTKDITIKGHRNGMWFLANTNNGVLNIGGNDYTITLDGENKTFEAENVTKYENSATIALTNVVFQNFNLNNTGNLVGSKPNEGQIILDRVTFKNCSNPKVAFIDKQRVTNDRLVLKGFLNQEGCTGTTIYAASETKSSGTTGRIKIDDNDFTANETITIEWPGTKEEGIVVVIGTKGQNAGKFALTDTDWKLVRKASNGDLYMTPAGWLDPVAHEYTHPGLLHTTADITRVKGLLTTEPFASAYARLEAQSGGSAAGAVEWLKRMDKTNWESTYPDYGNFSRAATDAKLAYELALRYQLKGSTAAATAAVNILNDWATNCKGVLRLDGYTNSIPDPNEYLLCIQAYQFANAAELLRGYTGWAADDFTAFKSWMRETFGKLAYEFLTTHHGSANALHYWLNWDLAALTAMYSVGVLCDDKGLVDFALDYVNNGTGTGNVANAIVATHDDPDSSETLAQCQESGRDQGHSTLDVTLMGVFCQMAQSQGTDLWTPYNALEMAEYVGKYNLKDANDNFIYSADKVPFTTYNTSEVNHTAISADGRGTVRPSWEVFHAYARNNDKSDIYTKQWVDYMRQLNAYGEAEGTSTDELGFGTLMFGEAVATTYTLTVTDAGAATLVLPFGADLPTGVKAYTLNYTAGNDKVKATEVTAITANQPVLINAEAGNYVFTSDGTTNTNAPQAGALTGVYASTVVPSGSYILTNVSGVVGFRKVNDSKNFVTANHAYLTADGAGAASLTIDFGNTTGINSVDNGQLTVDSYYDLQGRRVAQPTKGLYIVNGKKVMIK